MSMNSYGKQVSRSDAKEIQFKRIWNSIYQLIALLCTFSSFLSLYNFYPELHLTQFLGEPCPAGVSSEEAVFVH